jgi:hypothetical protein
MGRRAALRFVLALLLPMTSAAEPRWSRVEAAAWQARTGWLVGANFIPSTAVNTLEMWQAETFDPATIERELGWAEGLGFNSIRVFLHDLAWEQDPAGFLDRLDRVLGIAERHGLGVILVLLDGAWDPHPKPGRQPPPRPHVHNSRWVQAPGAEILGDPARHERLKSYVQGVIRRFRHDTRVQAFDLFNEPDNDNARSYGGRELPDKAHMALSLLKKEFAWAREMDPSQPLTVGAWRELDLEPARLTAVDRYALAESDVVSFHSYRPPAVTLRWIEVLERYGRPILCTEYLARTLGSTFADILPVLKEHRISAYNWGLVAGRTQTIYPWDSWDRPYTAPPRVWFHDLFQADGIAYAPAESRLIRALIGAGRKAAGWLQLSIAPALARNRGNAAPVDSTCGSATSRGTCGAIGRSLR